MNPREILLVGLGGFLGSVARFMSSSAATAMFAGSAESSVRFPIGTLVVNLIGCLLIGILAAWANIFQPLGVEARLFIFAGVLGGFTTFSAFSYETVELMRVGAWSFAAINVAVQVIGGLLAVWSGMRLVLSLQ